MKKLIIILLLVSFKGYAQPGIGFWFWSQLRNTGIIPPPPARQHLVFESLFNGVSYGGLTVPVEIGDPWGNQQHCCSYSIVAAPPAVVQCGQGAAAFEIRRTDPLVSSCSRTELTGPEFLGNTETWHGFNFYIPSSDQDDGTDQSMYQWHQEPASGIPAQALWISGANNWLFQHNTSGAIGVNNYVYETLQPVVRDVWTSFVIHIKTSQSNTGIIQIWINGALVLNLSNLNVGYSDGAYMKAGIYKFTWCVTPQPGNPAVTFRRAYLGQVRIANASGTFFDVSPGCY